MTENNPGGAWQQPPQPYQPPQPPQPYQQVPPPPPGAPYQTPGAPYQAGPMNTPIPMAAMSNGPQPSTALGASVVRGILAGLGAGFLAGLVWFGIVIALDRQIYYLAVVLGLAIGYAVSWGAGRGGPVVALIAGAIGLLSVVLSYYYVDRYFIIEGLEAEGYTSTLGLWPRFDQVRDVLRLSFEVEPMQYLFCALCTGGAAWFGYRGLENSPRFKRTRF